MEEVKNMIEESTSKMKAQEDGFMGTNKIKKEQANIDEKRNKERKEV
jgi:hypothetical protein